MSLAAIELELSPEMEALSQKQRSFVNFYIPLALKRKDGAATAAARAAGYCSEKSRPITVANSAQQLLRNPRIVAAIAAESYQLMRASVLDAVRVYRTVMNNPRAKDADKLRAADAVSARADPIVSGHVMRVEHEHRHVVDHTKAAIDGLRWMKSMGVPRDKLIEHFGENGLPRYEKMLAIEDARTIEGTAAEAA